MQEEIAKRSVLTIRGRCSYIRAKIHIESFFSNSYRIIFIFSMIYSYNVIKYIYISRLKIIYSLIATGYLSLSKFHIMQKLI